MLQNGKFSVVLSIPVNLVNLLVGKEPSFSKAITKLLKQNRATAHVTVIGHLHSPVTQSWGGKFCQGSTPWCRVTWGWLLDHHQEPLSHFLLQSVFQSTVMNESLVWLYTSGRLIHRMKGLGRGHVPHCGETNKKRLLNCGEQNSLGCEGGGAGEQKA